MTNFECRCPTAFFFKITMKYITTKCSLQLTQNLLSISKPMDSRLWTACYCKNQPFYITKIFVVAAKFLLGCLTKNTAFKPYHFSFHENQWKIFWLRLKFDSEWSNYIASIYYLRGLKNIQVSAVHQHQHTRKNNVR